MEGEKHPIISFIVPVYNFERYIAACIKSIQNQSIDNIEIIIINDGSTDNSRAVIDSLSSSDERIKAFHMINAGVSASRNVGLKHAQGDYIVFVDADDYLTSDYSEYMLSLIEGNKADFALSLNCFTKDGEKDVEKDTVRILSNIEGATLLLSPRVIVGCWNKIFRRSFLEKNGLKFSTSLFYGEGLHFITRAALLSNRVVTGLKKVYGYRRNNYSSPTSKYDIEKFRNGLKSIDEIAELIKSDDRALLKMLAYHRCQFYMGAIVRTKSAGRDKEFKIEYYTWLKCLRRSFLDFMWAKNISWYKKSLLFGTVLSPAIMSKFDDLRRRRIAHNSIN